MNDREVDQTINWLRTYLNRHFGIHLRKVRPDRHRWYLFNEEGDIVGTVDVDVFEKAAAMLEKHRLMKELDIEDMEDLVVIGSAEE